MTSFLHVRFHLGAAWALLGSLTLASLGFSAVSIRSQYPPVYDESQVPTYTLPPLRGAEETRRLFADHVYGHAPTTLPKMEVIPLEKPTLALDGQALRQQLRVRLTSPTAQAEFTLLLYTPAAAARPVPVFLGLNFFGNHTLHADPAIVLPTSWSRADPSKGVVNHRATEAGRGVGAALWSIETLLARGYGLANVYYGDLAPDNPEHVEAGVLAFFPRESRAAAGPRGGALAAWAWGLSRAHDALLTRPQVDPARIAVYGHSRLGKAALWAGACDPRFALVISNNSGCGGAALSRRRYGERLVHINHSFPHWFARPFRDYNERESALPVDQHQLIALMAPRAVYVASALEDQWADPRGEYLALAAAAPAWNRSLPADSPAVDQARHQGSLGYHVRAGRHALTAYDWQQYLDFADALWPRAR